MGLEKADEGTVSGMEHQKISAIFQENRLFENLDAVTNIHITTGKTKEEITGFLKKMELDDIAGKPVSEYSGVDFPMPDFPIIHVIFFSLNVQEK